MFFHLHFIPFFGVYFSVSQIAVENHICENENDVHSESSCLQIQQHESYILTETCFKENSNLNNHKDHKDGLLKRLVRRLLKSKL